MKLRPIAFAALTLAALPAGFAQAQDAPKLTMAQAMQVQRACKSDIERFCADVPRGGGKLASCMMDHKADLSPGCQSELKTVTGK